MFGFFKSDFRGSEQEAASAEGTIAAPSRINGLIRGSAQPASATSGSKRVWDSLDDEDGRRDAGPSAKRAKHGPHHHRRPDATWAVPATALEQARDVIDHQFGLEILLKHEELRLINQELAKSQIALEQLRRCHLIPYPQDCPTPDQMVNVSNGRGPALASRSGEPVPRWAPPFGVVDGPYARHYAKWLIPDPSFDGIQPEWQFGADHARARLSLPEGRTTRNSLSEPAMFGKGRPVRGIGGQKLQSLSSGYPQAKDKAGPCILKRSDGQTVKLVCLDCKRENFSSTQGFINHCRIAHKRDFKSHEEAAVHSGHPIEAADAGPSGAEDKMPAAATAGSHLVHPFARQDMTEQQACTSIRARLEESLKLYRAGKLPGVDSIPSSRHCPGGGGVKSTGVDKGAAVSETPHLCHLMERRNFGGSLRDLVADAKTKMSLEDITPEEESDEGETTPYGYGVGNAPPSRTPVVMRVPARSGKSPAPPLPGSKSRLAGMPLVLPTPGATSKDVSSVTSSDDDADMEDANLSPNTLISNNAPSLVSDDGEYDDSDEGSSVSGTSDHLEEANLSDVAEITLDDEHEPRALRRASKGVAGAVKLRKDDAKHVTFMSSVRSTTKQRKRGRV
ncbi:hypothetical protein DCS_01518 [Drechmeria coniospora]|uniref:AHC1-like C2H2 zinc-finger domain-containing protein n=1 Tax=Drechmeria coniospora TaxID=98403 RepID=A0A151GTI3_DRECN|nr:hypothetical protein DCS_01518 [Drechmeria coniospora]KYK60381.1 hypothetical protein DCS_01518 [Drechmeria coniospora]